MEILAENMTRTPAITIEPRKGLLQLGLNCIWQYRELLYFLVWRDVMTRYKQTAIGAAWVVLQPMITMVLFTLIFGTMARFPSDGVPYPLFAFAALLPWTYFAQALSKTAGSLVSSANLVSKIYFPRLLIPLAAALAPIVDLFFSFMMLLPMMAWYRVVPTWGLLTLPLFMLLAVMTVLSVGLWSAALNVRYRDMNSVIPFVIQIWLYASPVAYPVSMVPEKWRILYSLNPMVGVIEGFRWALLGKASPDLAAIMLSSAVVLVLVTAGVVYFKWMEQTFADVI